MCIKVFVGLFELFWVLFQRGKERDVQRDALLVQLVDHGGLSPNFPFIKLKPQFIIGDVLAFPRFSSLLPASLIAPGSATRHQHESPYLRDCLAEDLTHPEVILPSWLRSLSDSCLLQEILCFSPKMCFMCSHRWYEGKAWACITSGGAKFKASCLMLILWFWEKDTHSRTWKSVVGKTGCCFFDCLKGNRDDKPCSQKLQCVLLLLSFLKDQTGGKSAFCQLWVPECAQEVRWSLRVGQEMRTK